MAAGLQIFNSDGWLDVDVSDRLPRFLGIAQIGGEQASGSIYNPGIRPNTNIWWFIMSPSTNFANPEASSPTYEYPSITQGESHLYWNFPSGRRLSCTLLYGVY